MPYQSLCKARLPVERRLKREKSGASRQYRTLKSDMFDIGVRCSIWTSRRIDEYLAVRLEQNSQIPNVYCLLRSGP
jgi:hypothetical protein